MTSLIVEQDINNIISSLGASVNALAGKTVVISGSAGFLGNHFLVVLAELNRTVLKIPCSVVALDNLITGTAANPLQKITDPHFTFKEHDVCRPLRICGPVDYIVHMAGIASPFYYTKHPLETIRSATIGTENLLKLAREKKAKKFLFFSSSEIYGNPEYRFIPTPESYRGNVSSIGPRACYDESKRLGETLCMVYSREYKVPVAIARLFNVYGPGMKRDDRRVIPQFISCALSGRPLPVHGDGLQTRTYCYITDAIVGCFKALLLRRGEGVYNIGIEQGEINLIGLAKMITRLIGKKVKIAKIPYPREYPSDEPNRRCPDMTKAMRELHYKPRVGLEAGLKRLIAWVG